ncbi:hypothetical protein HN011_002455 [Eciton burchellii]|nr:hypothetical protein HN011_002455 [Eciton burchellii]
MRCFESFFKHTWRPQQVHQIHEPITALNTSRYSHSQSSPLNSADGECYQVDPPSKFELTTKKTTRMQQHMSGETTELGEVVISAATSSIATSTVHTNKDAPCKNGGCKNWRSGRSGNESRSESPWHLLKTVFLISVIVAFFLWIIIYTLLDHYRIL